MDDDSAFIYYPFDMWAIETHLHNAIDSHRTEEIRKLLHEDSADANAVDKYRRTPLHWAVYKKFEMGVKLLLESGANVDAHDKAGQTPLLYSVYVWDRGMTAILLENGANTNIQNINGVTPLHLAAKNGLPTIMELLLNKGAEMNRKDKNGNTALHLAVIYDYDFDEEQLEESAEIDTAEVNDEIQFSEPTETSCKSSVFLIKKGASSNEENIKGRSPFHYAVFYRRTRALRAMLENGSEVEAKYERNQTVLHLAAANGFLNIAECLIEYGASVNVQDDNGNTPLHLAAFSGSFFSADMVRLLLKNGAELEQKNTLARTPFFIAATKKRICLKVLNYLLDEGANIDAVDECKQTPFHIAVRRGRNSVCQFLLDRGSNVNVKNGDNNSPLGIALIELSKGGFYCIDIIEKILVNGADVENNIVNNLTPLLFTMEFNLEKGFELLLAWIDNFNITDEKENSPLHFAVKCNSTKLIHKLLEKGCKLEQQNKIGETPLHIAAKSTNLSVVRVLLDNGAVVDSMDNLNKTPLHIAAKLSNLSVVRLLLDNGAIADIKDNDGNTPLHAALYGNRAENAFELIGRGVDVNVKTKNGNTPLIIASKITNKKLVKTLLANGAELNQQDCNGNSALHFATENEQREIIEELLNGGAEVNITNFRGETPLYWTTKFVYGSNPWVIRKLLDWGASMTPVFQLLLTTYKTDSFLRNDKLIVFKKHFIKLKSIKLLMEENLEFDLTGFDNFQVACLEELEKMKINKFDRYSLYDVFHIYHDPLFVSNNELEQGIHSPLLDTEFPIFASLLKATFVRAKRRVVLLDTAQNLLRFPLPYEIRRSILSYLNDEDLKSLITSYEEIKSDPK